MWEKLLWHNLGAIFLRFSKNILVYVNVEFPSKIGNFGAVVVVIVLRERGKKFNRFCRLNSPDGQSKQNCFSLFLLEIKLRRFALYCMYGVVADWPPFRTIVPDFSLLLEFSEGFFSLVWSLVRSFVCWCLHARMKFSFCHDWAFHSAKVFIVELLHRALFAPRNTILQKTKTSGFPVTEICEWLSPLSLCSYFDVPLEIGWWELLARDTTRVLKF
jgi:hypothetical protein